MMEEGSMIEMDDMVNQEGGADSEKKDDEVSLRNK